MARALEIVDVSESSSEHGGGVRTYVHHKIAAATAAGHRVTIVAPGHTDGVERRAGARIVWIGGPRSPFDERYGMFRDEAAIHAVLDREAPDVVEGSSPWLGGRAVASWRGRAVKSFVFHTDPVAVWPQTFFGRHVGFDRIDRLCRPYWRHLARVAGAYDVTVTSGAWLARRLAAHGIPRTREVPFGIDKSRFSPLRRDPGLRAELLARCGLPPEADLLVAVGRLDPEKRIGTILAAHRRVARRRPVGLVICGRGSLERWIRCRTALRRNVHVMGYVSHPTRVADLMASADAFVHGSAAETYGLVVAEAIASGLPCIVPDRGGAVQLARPEHAETYAAGDPAACAAAIERLLDRDRAALRRACAAARRDVATLDDHFGRLFALYRELAPWAGVANPLRAAS